MRRFYVEGISPGSSTVEITGEEFFHLRKVLRLRAGDGVAVFDGTGLELMGVIGSVGRGSAVVSVTGSSRGRNESPLEITLLQGLVKGGKPDLVIQKATELGATGVFFYPSSRSIPDINEAKAGERIKRWRKIAVEAVKQCGRTIVPDVGYFGDLEEALTGRVSDLKLLLYEGEGAASLREAFAGKKAGSVTVVTGPEGGFSGEEAGLAMEKGYMAVTLGPRVLRAETASIAALSIIQYELGGMER